MKYLFFLFSSDEMYPLRVLCLMYSNTTDIITASVNPCGKLLATVRIMSMIIILILFTELSFKGRKQDSHYFVPLNKCNRAEINYRNNPPDYCMVG